MGGTGSWDGTAANKWATASGGSTTTTIPTSADSCFFDANSTGTVTISTGNTGCGSLNFTGFTQTATGTGALTISGSSTFATGMTLGYTGAMTIDSTSTITSNGKIMFGTLTINATNTVTLADALYVSSTLALTAGTFNANNQNVTANVFDSNNPNIRTLTMGSGTWTITGGGTAWSLQTSTNLSCTSSGRIKFTGVSPIPRIGSTSPGCYNDIEFAISGTGSILTSNTVTETIHDLYVSSGTGFSFGSFSFPTYAIHTIDFTGFSGSWTGSSNPKTISGNVILGAGMTTATTGRWTFNATSGVQTITSNGVPWVAGITLDGVGGTLQLADALVLQGGGSPGAGGVCSITLTNGTFDANNKNITIKSFSSLNSNTRSLLMGSGTWTLTATSTVWDVSTPTGMTLVPSSSLILLTSTSSIDKTFAGGGLTYNNIWNATASSGAMIVTGSNTFNDFKIDAGRTVSFTAGTTQTMASMTAIGTATSPITLQSTASNTYSLVKTGGDVVDGQYLIIYNAVASPVNTWYAGPAYGSTNGGGNSGWGFSPAASASIGGSVALSGGGGSSGPFLSSGFNSSVGTSTANSVAMTSTPSPIVPSSAYQFSRNLRLGMIGDDVREFQKYLNEHNFIIAASGSGSPGNETTKFGALTFKALIKFQEFYKNEILIPAGVPSGKGTGFLGPFTRAHINGR